MKLHRYNGSATIQLTLIWFCAVIVEVMCQDNSGVPTNPCAVTLCPVNTMCIEIPDPRNCHRPQQMGCAKMAKCVPQGMSRPNNNGGNLGGQFCGRQRCQFGERCEYVQPHCFTTPCPPMLQCVPASVKESEADMK